MDPSDVYPDLLGQGFSHSSQRLAQMGSLLASWVVVEARRKERRNAAKTARSRGSLRRCGSRNAPPASWRGPAGRPRGPEMARAGGARPDGPHLERCRGLRRR